MLAGVSKRKESLITGFVVASTGFLNSFNLLCPDLVESSDGLEGLESLKVG